ncbi:MAG TPA: hypothetical protein VGW39_16360 [Chthoniobacterales bacterium]|nr:hypothetical protein [Chthoniobacterales bacterium]
MAPVIWNDVDRFARAILPFELRSAASLPAFVIDAATVGALESSPWQI